jgi:hypothetical protein
MYSLNPDNIRYPLSVSESVYFIQINQIDDQIIRISDSFIQLSGYLIDYQIIQISADICHNLARVNILNSSQN